jgi:hypothetical protein
MSLPPRQQQRSGSRAGDTQRGTAQRSESPLSPAPAPAPAQDALAHRVTPQAAGKRQGLMLEAPEVAAGRGGVHNLRIEWSDRQLGNWKTCRFVISTAADHTLEALVEQQSYRRPYQGTTTLQTELVPLAPMGTRGKLTVRDTTTGEVLVQRWRWVTWGPLGLWRWLLSLVQRLSE